MFFGNKKLKAEIEKLNDIIESLERDNEKLKIDADEYRKLYRDEIDSRHISIREKYELRVMLGIATKEKEDLTDRITALVNKNAELACRLSDAFVKGGER